MNVVNVHDREYSRSVDEVGALIDTLATPYDRLSPKATWPPIRFDRPLQVGARGGHGLIRYSIAKYVRSRSILFRFERPRGFDGTHGFRVEETDRGTTRLMHFLEMTTRMPATITWPLVFRPMHDALIEDALARADVALEVEPKVVPWSPWVRLLRWTLTRGKARPQTIEHGPAGHRIVTEPYDPSWPERFERERELLESIFRGAEASIEHVGSTAVEGLGGKPVLDILIGVEQLELAESRIDSLRGADYAYVPEYETELPDRRYFRKPQERPSTHHLHIVRRDSDFWRDHLLFRDALRRDSRLADEYFTLKQRLASVHPAGAYTEAKSEFIQEVLRKTKSPHAREGMVR